MPPSAIASASDASSWPSTVWPMASCRSRSASIARLLANRGIGLCGLTQKHGQCRQVAVPFDERGPRPEAAQCCAIEGPDRRGHLRAMVVDQDLLPVDVVDAVAREMELADRPSRQRRQIGFAVEAEIAAAHMDVVDVAKQAAAGAGRERGQEGGLLDGGMAVAQ